MTETAGLELLIVDDHPLYRAGVTAVLASHMPGVVVHGADDAESGLGVLRRHPQVAAVLLDLRLPGMDGLTALKAYAQAFPLVARLLISGQDADPGLVQRALNAGASGFIPKTLAAGEMAAALRTVLDGGVYIPPLAESASVPAGTGPESLSLRQLEVLSLLVRGLSNKEIAQELDIVERTVKAHISRIFEALAVDSRVQAVIAAQKLGIAASLH